jgi:hypothetical protein
MQYLTGRLVSLLPASCALSARQNPRFADDLQNELARDTPEYQEMMNRVMAPQYTNRNQVGQSIPIREIVGSADHYSRVISTCRRHATLCAVYLERRAKQSP